MDAFKIIRKHELSTSEWSGGTTTQLAIWPEDAIYAKRNFMWRVSSARVEAETSEFTSLPGVARCLMILDGTLWLKHEGHYETTLKRFAQDNFSGDWKTVSRGRVTDFNLMTTSGEGRVQIVETASLSKLKIEFMPVVKEWKMVSEVFYFLDGNMAVSLPDGTSTDIEAGDVLIVHRQNAAQTPHAEFDNRNDKTARTVRAIIYHDCPLAATR